MDDAGVPFPLLRRGIGLGVIQPLLQPERLGEVAPGGREGVGEAARAVFTELGDRESEVVVGLRNRVVQSYQQDVCACCELAVTRLRRARMVNPPIITIAKRTRMVTSAVVTAWTRSDEAARIARKSMAGILRFAPGGEQGANPTRGETPRYLPRFRGTPVKVALCGAQIDPRTMTSSRSRTTVMPAWSAR